MEKTVNALRVLNLCIFIAMIGLGIVSPIIPNYASELGATGLTIGLIYSGFSVSRTILQTPVGRLADDVSKKKIILVGLVVYTLTSFLYSLATSPEMLIAVRTIHGVGSAMVMPVAMAYAIEITPTGEEGKYMGHMNTAIFAGFGTGPLLGGFIYERYSISTVFHAMSVMIIISLILTFLLVPEEEGIGKANSAPKAPITDILRNRRLTGVFIYRMVNALGRGVIMVFLPLFAVQTLGISGTAVGLILSIGIFTTALMQTPMGYLADRYNKPILLAVGGLVSSIGYFYTVYSTNAGELTVSRLIISSGAALSIPALTSIVAEEGKTMGAGSTMGMLNTSMSIGQIAGPTLTGVIMDTYGIGAVFNFAGLIGIISIMAFYVISKGRLQDNQKS